MVEGNGRYQIKKTLAQSKVATVYRVHDREMGQTVVVKQFPQLWRDEAFDAVFQQTLSTLQAVQHEAIAPIHSFGKWNGQLYLSMPHYGGGSLASKLVHGPLTPTQITPILTRICGALEAAQQQEIIHWHLSPENVLFDTKGSAYVSDFGVVHDQAATFAPDPRYASPEEAANLPVDARTNIYHVGLLLFQMLTGRVPFEAPTPSAILQLHRYGPIPSARVINAAVPAKADAICRRALAKHPEERFATITDLLAAWQALIGAGSAAAVVASGQVVAAETAVTPPRAVSFFPRLLAGLGVLLAVVIVGAFWWGSRDQNLFATELVATATAVNEGIIVPTSTPRPPTPLPPTVTATITETAVASPTATPSPTATAVPSHTATATATPSLTATATPTATSTLLPIQQTITLGQPSGTVRNPVAFAWMGSAAATYRVVLVHEGQVFTHNSGWIQGLGWTFSFPAEEFGGWNWYVEDQQGSRSATGFFWFNEFAGGDGGNGPTAVPTDQPPPP